MLIKHICIRSHAASLLNFALLRYTSLANRDGRPCNGLSLRRFNAAVLIGAAIPLFLEPVHVLFGYLFRLLQGRPLCCGLLIAARTRLLGTLPTQRLRVMEFARCMFLNTVTAGANAATGNGKFNNCRHGGRQLFGSRG